MYITIIFGLLIASLLGVSAWFLAGTVHRLLGMVLFFVSVPLVTYAFIALMGVAKPVYPPLFEIEPSHTVIQSYVVDEGKAMYVLMVKEDGTDPILYAFAWSQELAEKLQMSMQMTDGNGKVRLTKSDLTGNGYGISADIPIPDPPKAKEPTAIIPTIPSGGPGGHDR